MTIPYSFGFHCSGCGAWIPNGITHACPGRYTPPNPAPFAPTITEERVRQIVREEIERAKQADE